MGRIRGFCCGKTAVAVCSGSPAPMSSPPMRQSAAPLRERQAAAVHASPTAALRNPHVRAAVIALAAGVFMAVVGAFGSGEAPLLSRLFYWVSVIGVGALAGSAVAQTVRTRGWLEERPWLQGGLTVLILWPPLTVAVWLITVAIFNRRDGLGGLLGFFGPVLVVTAVMTAINYATQLPLRETHAAAPGAPPPAFLERLPFRLRGAALLAVEAEDHYLRLHTDRGSDLILMRLSDAVRELEGLEGAQTHRSWWVAREAVEDVRRADGRAVLRLKGGVDAPVSRTHAKALREAGWF